MAIQERGNSPSVHRLLNQSALSKNPPNNRTSEWSVVKPACDLPCHCGTSSGHFLARDQPVRDQPASQPVLDRLQSMHNMLAIVQVAPESTIITIHNLPRQNAQSSCSADLPAGLQPGGPTVPAIQPGGKLTDWRYEWGGQVY